LDEGRTIREVARDLDVWESSLGNWVRQAEVDLRNEPSKPTGEQIRQAKLPPGRYEVDLVTTSATGEELVRVPLSVQVLEEGFEIVVTPASLDFGVVPGGDSARQNNQILNSKNRNVTVTPEVPAGFRLLDPTPLELRSASARTRTVIFEPTRGGDYDEVLRFSITGADRTFDVQLLGQTQQQSSSLLVDIDSGGTHTCMLRQNGRILCFGEGTLGQLGSGDRFSQMEPVEVLLTEPADQISLGERFSCARRQTDRSVAC